MNKVLKLLILLPAIFFIVTGVRWLVAPAGVAPMFGLTLDEGVGLSSQVGDMTGFFLTLGSCILIALISGRRTWYYPAIMLLAITALGRIVAWLVYDSGWDRLRQQRLERAANLGIVPQDTAMVRMSTTADWEALSAERKRYEAKRMAVYAGMIEAMDFHIGRLIAFLKERGQYDNTIFIFTSDNGSEASGPDDPGVFPLRLVPERLGYHTDYDRLGLKGSYNSISPSFASASASPLAYFKFYTGEGGMRVPLIIAGSRLPRQNALTPAFAWATDISPTILSLAGVAPPGERYAGRPVLPMTGRDLSPLLAGTAESVYGPDDAVGYELTDHAALFQGDYKLVVNQPPVGDGQWRLFNIVEDPGETTDLASVQPTRFQRMLSRYLRYQQENGVLPTPAGYSQMKQLVLNTLRLQYREQIITTLLVLLLLLPFFLAYRMKREKT